MFFRIIFLFVWIQAAHFVVDENDNENNESNLTEQQIITNLLGNNSQHYDWRKRPRGTLKPTSDHHPVDVSCNLFLRSISEVDEINNKITLQITFRQEWIDERLNFASDVFDHVNLLPAQRIWLPDTFFQNELDGKKHEIDQPNVFLRIKKNQAKVLYSTRLTLTLSCPMLLKNFPFDVQKCSIDFAPFAHTMSDIIFHWSGIHPIQVKAGLSHGLSKFTLKETLTESCSSSTNTGSYSCLQAIMIFERDYSYYISQLYIPSIIFVIVSWITFWLNKDQILIRLSLSFAALLMLLIQVLRINGSLPQTPHMKAIDIWMNVCFSFIFWTILEFVLVHLLAGQNNIRRDNWHRQKFTINEIQNDDPNALIPQNNVLVEDGVTEQEPNNCWFKFWQKHDKASKLDLFSRVLFPICFLIFNVVYWINYLS
uniref:Glutamate-gated chloride channel n=1 Tax=Panagrolaimus sp. JU765 TaxID=591449 RepID=A0AC34RBS0_9BILA